MWLVYALFTFLAWGAADLFYKKGADAFEKYSHLKTSIMVGLVMGITAVITLITKDIHYNPINLLIYMPVSAMYILSMTVGYFGLRYLEVSVSSPIQNASGAVSALMMMILFRELPDAFTGISMVLITAGVILLGVFERNQAVSELENKDVKYLTGFKAIIIPVLYCIIDSLGTFFDGWYLDDPASTPLKGVSENTIEDVANVSYQLTFLIVAVLLFIYVRVIKKERMAPLKQKDRLFASLFETGGQLTYVYALSGNGIVAAPVISSYCVASLIFGRIFLKEKLSAKQYCAVALVIGGIVILGILEGIEGA